MTRIFKSIEARRLRYCIGGVLLIGLLLLSFAGQVAAEAPPGTLQIELHTADLSIEPLDIITTEVRLRHVGGSSPAATTMSMTLPDRVQIVDLVQISEQTATASPLLVTLDDNVVEWSGGLSPGAEIRFELTLQFGRCFSTGNFGVELEAQALQVGGGVISDSDTVTVDCTQASTLDDLTWQVELLETSESASRALARPANIDRRRLHIRVTNNASVPNTAGIDIKTGGGIPGAVGIDEQSSTNYVGCLTCTRGLEDSSPQATVPGMVIQPGETRDSFFDVVIELNIDDATEIPLDVTLCLLDIDEAVCPNPEVAVPGQLDEEQVVWTYKARDLGDAPDSTNHFAGVAMLAYPATAAAFPTVHDPALGVPFGPVSRNPRPFHLGQRVSPEVEADGGPDADPSNNIRPPANSANLDRFDDGAQPWLWPIANCQTMVVNVRVFINPAAVAYFTNVDADGMGHINIWWDGDRDGSWDDGVNCPQGQTAVEHIAINAPVDVVALGAGLHTVAVSTGLVPNGGAGPAWARVTLSERAYPTPLLMNGISYGDGRGFATPFERGEIEDYYVGQQQADVGVDIVGQWQLLDNSGRAAQPTPIYMSVYRVTLRSQGEVAANNVSLTVDLPEQTVIDTQLQDELAQHLSCQLSNGSIVCQAESLPPETGGTLLIRARRTEARMADEVSATATVTADNDGFADNNSDTASIMFETLVPRILRPQTGMMCGNSLQVVGFHPDSSANIQVYVDAVLSGVVQADGGGLWQHTVAVGPGAHQIVAVAEAGGAYSGSSNPLNVINDPSLTFSPISLSIADGDGNQITPYNNAGRMPLNGWTVDLQSKQTYDFRVRACGPNAAVQLFFDGTSYAAGDPDGDGLFEGSFSTAPTARAAATIAVRATVAGNQVTGVGTAVIDEAWPQVIDATSGDGIGGANVLVLQRSGDRLYPWLAELFGYTNPLQSLGDGSLDLYLTPGDYRMRANAAGYQLYRSERVAIRGANDSVPDLPLTPSFGSRFTPETVAIDGNGYSPALLEISTGTVVEWTNLDFGKHSATSVTPSLIDDGFGSGAWDSGLLQSGESYQWRFDLPGTYVYGDSENPNDQGMIIVSGLPTSVGLQTATTHHRSAALLLPLLLTLAATLTLFLRRGRRVR